MTQEEKAWAYDGALNRAKAAIDIASDKDLVKGVVTTIFPRLREGQENDVIDIPFGAHDSELKGWEYTIPEGFTAEIKDGKVIVKEKESEDERIRKELINFILYKAKGVSEEQEHSWVAYLENQKINTEGDFGRGYDCGYEACLNSHGAEWFEKQKEIPMSDSTKMIKMWDEEKKILERMYLRGDTWRLIAYNAFIDGLARGTCVKSEKQKEQKSIENVVKDITKNKEAAIKFLKSTGIMDDNGELAEMYRSEEQKPADFPTTDEEVNEFLETHPKVEVPEKYKTPDFVFSKQEYESHPIISKDTTSVRPAEWSEKDEALLKEIIAFFKDGTVKLQHDLDLYASFLEHRLKSLRPQPKREWSEEDEIMLNSIINVVCGIGSQPNGLREKQVNWLKSLPERFSYQTK